MAALGLLLLVAAGVLGLAGVLANSGSRHLTDGSFAILGYHITGSTGRLFLYGIILGAVAMLGLNMLLAGIGRGFKRRVSSRRELKQTRRASNTAQQERDQLEANLADERAAREKAEAEAAARPQAVHTETIVESRPVATEHETVVHADSVDEEKPGSRRL